MSYHSISQSVQSNSVQVISLKTVSCLENFIYYHGKDHEFFFQKKVSSFYMSQMNVLCKNSLLYDFGTVKNSSLDTHLRSDTFAFCCLGSADCGIQGVQLIVIHKQISCLVYFVIGYQNVEIKF